MSTPAERLVALLPPDACRELVARIDELLRRRGTGVVATVRVCHDGRVSVEVVKAHREYLQSRGR